MLYFPEVMAPIHKHTIIGRKVQGPEGKSQKNLVGAYVATVPISVVDILTV